jgi:hypothetical protein
MQSTRKPFATSSSKLSRTRQREKGFELTTISRKGRSIPQTTSRHCRHRAFPGRLRCCAGAAPLHPSRETDVAVEKSYASEPHRIAGGYVGEKDLERKNHLFAGADANGRVPPASTHSSARQKLTISIRKRTHCPRANRRTLDQPHRRSSAVAHEVAAQ